VGRGWVGVGRVLGVLVCVGGGGVDDNRGCYDPVFTKFSFTLA